MMKKNLYHRLLFVFSVTLGILMVLFNPCISYSTMPQIETEDITYFITMDFDPNTQKLSQWHVVTKNEAGHNISTLETSAGDKTQLNVHDNAGPNGHVIILQTIRDAITAKWENMEDLCLSGDACELISGTNRVYGGLLREDSEIPLVLKDVTNDQNTIRFSGWVIHSSFGDNIHSWSVAPPVMHMISCYLSGTDCKSVTNGAGPMVISNDYKKNCKSARTLCSGLAVDNREILTGSMTIIFDDLKDRLKTASTGTYEGSTLYTGDSFIGDCSGTDCFLDRSRREKYTFIFRVHKLPSIQR